MFKKTVVITFIALITVAIVGCTTTTLRTEEKVLICSGALTQLVLPQCDLIPGEKYTEFCEEVIAASATACEAGFTDNPSLMCSEIGNQQSGCDLIPFEEGDDVDGPKICKQVLSVGELVCMVFVREGEVPDGH